VTIIFSFELLSRLVGLIVFASSLSPSPFPQSQQRGVSAMIESCVRRERQCKYGLFRGGGGGGGGGFVFFFFIFKKKYVV
jgi:hypothetical protein